MELFLVKLKKNMVSSRIIDSERPTLSLGETINAITQNTAKTHIEIIKYLFTKQQPF